MISEIKKLFDRKIAAAIAERTAAMKKAIRGSDLPLAKEHLGYELGMEAAKVLFADALAEVDGEDDDTATEQEDMDDDETKDGAGAG